MSIVSCSTTTTTAYKVTADTTGTLVLQTGSIPTTAVTIDTSQNVGLGVTPSTYSSGKAIEIGAVGNGYYTFSAGNSFLTLGGYYNSGWKYSASSQAASQIEFQDNLLIFKRAASGTAGNTLTWSESMRLNASGQLGISTSSPFAPLVVVGTDFNAYFIRTTSSASEGVAIGGSSGLGRITSNGAIPLTFEINGTERGRISSGGNWGFGDTNPSANYKVNVLTSGASGSFNWYQGANQAIAFYAGGTVATGFSTANACGWFSKDSATSRSINCAGTVNQNGADYAEYMTKAGDFTVAKGDVVGINADGELTNVFDDAVSFVVKSTDPGLVGGDSWFTEEIPKDEEGSYQKVGDAEYDAWLARMEAARAKVDRIAFCGQVPVNVTGANAGQYIIPVNDNGAIKGEAVSNPTFEQYQQAVGKVIAIEQDGRARIIVKVA